MSIFHDKPLIVQTIGRIKHYFPKDERIFIVPEELKQITYKYVGKEHIIIEPIRRNTAAAICLAAMMLSRDYEDGVLHIMPADHIINTQQDFISALKFGQELAEHGYLVTYGIKPDRPETGYGYIKIGRKMSGYDGLTASRGEGFTEKPSLIKAKKYVQSKRYLWNSGIFTFRITTILTEIKDFIPEVYQGVQKYLNKKEKKHFKKIPDISIDYGVMEKSNRLCIVKGNFIWDDVGSWLALERFFKKDKDSNIVIGDARELETNHSIMYTNGLPLKVYGLQGVVVVVSPRGVLVCNKNRVQDLKKLLA